MYTAKIMKENGHKLHSEYFSDFGVAQSGGQRRTGSIAHKVRAHGHTFLRKIRENVNQMTESLYYQCISINLHIVDVQAGK